MTRKSEIVIILTALSYLIPILYFILVKNALYPFSLKRLTNSINLALIVHLILAIIYLILMSYIGKKFYSEGLGTNFTDILADTGTTYTIFGSFIYFPAIILLNIFSFFKLKNHN
jgi:hypothetical protein